MFGGMCISIVVMLWGLDMGWWTTPLGPHPTMQVDYTLTAAGVLIMFLVGLCDDIYDLHPKAKLIGQTAAAVVVVMSGVVFDGIHNPFGPGYIMFDGWSYPITVIYLVAFANIINLIDGLDGLAAGISAISMSAVLVFSVMSGRSESVLFAVIVIGACLGFLKYNHHPASIFMGDSGGNSAPQARTCADRPGLQRPRPSSPPRKPYPQSKRLPDVGLDCFFVSGSYHYHRPTRLAKNSRVRCACRRFHCDCDQVGSAFTSTGTQEEPARVAPPHQRRYFHARRNRKLQSRF